MEELQTSSKHRKRLHPFYWDTMSDVRERSAVLRQVGGDLSVGKYVIHHNMVMHIKILTTVAPH